MNTTFLGEPYAYSEDSIYYHGFKKGGVVFSALHYIVFNHKEQQFFGKIQSVFQDNTLDMKRAEVSVFQFVPDDGTDRGNENYHELWSVVGDTIEISLSSIEAKEVAIVHVPPTIKDEDIMEYVDENIGKVEHSEEEESDYDSDDDMSDFIVKGEVFGFYQYSVDQNDKIHYAPPPKFSDKCLSFETMDPEDKLSHEFVEYLKYKYIAPKLGCFTDKTTFTDEDIIQRLLIGEYAVHDDRFYFAIAPQEIEMDCDIDKTKALVAFVFLLKTMLMQPEPPSLIDLYTFCLKFELNV